ncbi:hypothetical protein [Bradyrhizobium sp. LA6.7]|uniref:hypothetical protein n=1 Tax=unclassified Bradyrhizobium TaxID=2631580 RepID=UPI003395763D
MFALRSRRGGMSALTRTGSGNQHQETWHTCLDDVHMPRSTGAPACRFTSINGDGLSALPRHDARARRRHAAAGDRPNAAREGLQADPLT